LLSKYIVTGREEIPLTELFAKGGGEDLPGKALQNAGEEGENVSFLAKESTGREKYGASRAEKPGRCIKLRTFCLKRESCGPRGKKFRAEKKKK